jgi:uncharacterized membrane protein
VCLAIAAAFVNNLGVNLQKLAWTKKQTGTAPEGLYRSFWVLGMIGIVMASFFDFAALAFGPQSVIAPLGSLTMVRASVLSLIACWWQMVPSNRASLSSRGGSFVCMYVCMYVLLPLSFRVVSGLY